MGGNGLYHRMRCNQLFKIGFIAFIVLFSGVVCLHLLPNMAVRKCLIPN